MSMNWILPIVMLLNLSFLNLPNKSVINSSFQSVAFCTQSVTICHRLISCKSPNLLYFITEQFLLRRFSNICFMARIFLFVLYCVID